jgi:hypothetical protein
MVIELGAPHATYLPDAIRRLGPSRRVSSECSGPSRQAVFSGRVDATEARFCWLASIQSWNHLADSLFWLTLGFIGSFGRTVILPGLLRAVELWILAGDAPKKANH